MREVAPFSSLVSRQTLCLPAFFSYFIWLSDSQMKNLPQENKINYNTPTTMNFTLIGMPAAGKSSIGKILADRTGFKFLDIDKIMEKECGEKIAILAAKLGDAGFIAKESETIIARTRGKNNLIISTGGSAVYGGDAMRHLRETSKIIYLKASLSTIERRLGVIPRGIIGLDKKTLEELYGERCMLYEKYADAIFDADRESEAVIGEVLVWMRRYTA